MSPKQLILSLSVLSAAFLAAVSCSTTRVLGENEYRLAGNKVEITNSKRFNPKEVQSYIKQKPNTYLIGRWNPLLVLYNWSGTDTGKASTRFIRKMGVAPVVYQPSQVEASIENIERHLEYLGYYGSKVESEITAKGKTIDVLYKVTLGKRFKIGKLNFIVPEGDFATDFFADTSSITIRSGDYLSEAELEKETERAAAYFRRNGYYGFSKNYFFFEADTLASRDTADLTYEVREYTRNQTPEMARKLEKYTVGDVRISYDSDLEFSERVLRDINTVKPGATYDETDINNTYSRLSALRIFNGVNISLTGRDSSSVVDCDISLTKSRMQGFKLELEGSTNSSGLVGISPQLSYYHKNLFHGGQWLNLSFLGNFQFKYNDRSIKSNEFGVSSSISFPEFVGLPNSIFKGPSVPRTEIKSSYNFQDRPEYVRNMLSLSYGYSGSLRSGKLFYQVFPLQAKLVKLSNMDPAFYNRIEANPFMRDAYRNHLDAGVGATAYFTTSTELNPRSTYSYGRLSVDASGNVLSLFDNLMKYNKAMGYYQIMGMPYSQYLRGELTLGRTLVFGKNDNMALACRLLAGVGYAYGNSMTLPYEKQFYAGGASSMRGWQARALGPGRESSESMFVIPSQAGDMKLEANIEYRFPMFWKLNGALFADVGNIWDIHGNLEDDNLSRFDVKTLPESLAANWGAGVRLDLNFLILRVDLGVKLYNPASDIEEHWYGPGSWFSGRDAFAIHFGVGYPF